MASPHPYLRLYRGHGSGWSILPCPIDILRWSFGIRLAGPEPWALSLGLQGAPSVDEIVIFHARKWRLNKKHVDFENWFRLTKLCLLLLLWLWLWFWLSLWLWLWLWWLLLLWLLLLLLLSSLPLTSVICVIIVNSPQLHHCLCIHVHICSLCTPMHFNSTYIDQ